MNRVVTSSEQSGNVKWRER